MSNEGQTPLAADLCERIDAEDHHSAGRFGGQTGREWILTS